jgi:hypothetical protein
VKGTLGNKLVELSGTVFALFQRLIGKFLKRFFYISAGCAFVFINGHLGNLQKLISSELI